MPFTSPYEVLIDDSDSQVVYTGAGWFSHNSTDLNSLGNFGGTTYLHTSHGIQVNGSLSFSFQGTQVRLTGTNNQKNILGVFDPKWECFVDNINIGAPEPAEKIQNNWIICDKDMLSDGPHEITLNVTSAGQTFWFDKIQYRPSPNLTFDTVVLLIDNHDPGVVFDSRWQSEGAYNMTETYGSTAAFNFTGTHVDWLGTFPNNSPHDPSSATYSVDGGAAVPFNLQGSPGMIGQVLFSTPDLPAGPHTLLVTYMGGGQQMPLTFDCLYLTNVSLSASTSTNSTSTSSSVISSSTISGTSPQGMQKPYTKGIPVGIIIGGVIGGAGALVVLVFIFFQWRGRKRGDPGLGDTDTSTRYHESGVMPYTHSSSSTPTSAYIGAPSTSRLALRKSRDLHPLQRVDDMPPQYTENY